MSPESDKKLQQIYEEALELPRAKRRRFVDFACADSVEMRLAVLKLLETRGELEPPTAKPGLATPVPGTAGAAETLGRTVAMESSTDRLHMQKINRYIIKGELGKGAMGAVYEAVDPMIGRTVALKVLLSNITDEDENKALEDRLFREASSAGRLAHPGIVTVFDVGKEDQRAFIAMERVEGPTLQQMMKDRKIDRNQALEILRQAASALDYAHAEGIIHRDIKPANIMLHKGAQAKIADFGIAKVSSMSQLTIAGTILGTPSYMSPEQIQNQPLEGTSDQFSLAVVAYEILTGAKPFERETMPALMLAIVNGDRPCASKADPTLPALVDEVFQMALNRLPEQRFGSCTAFVNALAGSLGIEFSAYSGTGSGIHPVGTTPPPGNSSSITGPRAPVQPPPPPAPPTLRPPPPPPLQAAPPPPPLQAAPPPPPLQAAPPPRQQQAAPPPRQQQPLGATAVNYSPPPPPPQMGMGGNKFERKPQSRVGMYVAGGILLVALAAAYPIYRYVSTKSVPADTDKEKPKDPPVANSNGVNEPAKKEEAVVPPAETKVAGAPTVGAFSAEPQRVKPGASTTLSWAVTDSVEVVIEPDIGKVEAKGSVEVKPKKDTEYVLKATGMGGEVTSRVKVTMETEKAPPVVVAERAKTVSEPDARVGAVHADPARAQQLYEEGMSRHRGQPGSAAVPAFEQAAALGEPRAMLELGKIYSAGDGVSKDPSKAAEWYRKAADLGNASAMVFLGALYAQGSGVPKDMAEAARWIRKAADAGNAVAMDGLGQMYANGQGLPVDMTQAVAWYRKAVENNNAAAMYHLGLILENGSGAIGKNAAEAAQLFQRAAGAGYAPAKAKVGGGGGGTAGLSVTGIDKGGIAENKSQLYRLSGVGFTAACTVSSDNFSSMGSRDGQYDHRPMAVAPDGSWLAIYMSLPPQLGRNSVKLTVKNATGAAASLDVPVVR